MRFHVSQPNITENVLKPIQYPSRRVAYSPVLPWPRQWNWHFLEGVFWSWSKRATELVANDAAPVQKLRVLSPASGTKSSPAHLPSVSGLYVLPCSQTKSKRKFPAPWWRHQMKTFSALLTICVGNSPVPGEFPAHRPVTRSFDVFFDLRLNNRLGKQSWGWWFETLPRPL